MRQTLARIASPSGCVAEAVKSRDNKRREEVAMRGVILVILDQPETAPALLRAAARLADLLNGAAVHALIIRTPPRATILPTEEMLTKQWEDRIRAVEQAREAALTEVLHEWTQHANRAANLSVVEAIASDVVASRGAAADFVVIGQSTRQQHYANWQAIHAALFETDRPVLVVPPKAGDGFGRRVAVAWRDDTRTTRAVLTAMRCFSQVERVIVLAGHREGRPLPRMPELLVEHSVAADLHVLSIGERVFGELMLERAHAYGADMLVMGAYVHDPVRRLMLGGVTKYMLAHADLPLLMRH
jgi:nucleotide-binding universal stress UspA family protein